MLISLGLLPTLYYWNSQQSNLFYRGRILPLSRNNVNNDDFLRLRSYKIRQLIINQILVNSLLFIQTCLIKNGGKKSCFDYNMMILRLFLLTLHGKKILLFKGQLNSEWIYEVIVSPKVPTKNCKDFCPGSLLEGRAEILQIFGWHFGRNDDLINSFWS